MILIGDCREKMRELIADNVRVQTCVTSPPYWGLRDYGTATWEGGDMEMFIGFLLLTICNLIILGLNLKLYTEYFKDRSISKRG